MAFIAFEGLDFSGKSTLKRSLGEELRQRGLSVCETYEPGDSPLGKQLRQILLASSKEEEKDNQDNPKEGKKEKKKKQALCSLSELFLMLADRAQHVEEVLRPALSRGEWVLCDRFAASSVAFQGMGRGLGEKRVEALNLFATGNLQPNLTVFLDFSYEAFLKRKATLLRSVDRIEKESSSFHERVRESYLKQARENKETWLLLNANLSPEKLLQETLEHITAKEWLGKRI